MSNMEAEIGVIGGTSVYSVDFLENMKYVKVQTPFGYPSDDIALGTLGDTRVAFLPRHGRGHRLLPTEVPFKANIYAMKKLGVKYIVSINVCGSLKEELKPRDIVLPDQFMDFTKHRENTFFGDGCVAHVEFSHPTCENMTNIVEDAILESKGPACTLHRGGTMVCIEGPQFSTMAESHMYRSLGGNLIGMTAYPECRLVREAEIAYCCMSLITDYDCWRSEGESVSASLVFENLKHCASMAQLCVRSIVSKLAKEHPRSDSHTALKNSIITPINKIPQATKAKLHAIIQNYID